MEIKSESLLDLSKTISGSIFEGVGYPWKVLPKIKDFIIDIGKSLSKDKFYKLKEDVWVSKSAKVSNNAFICGPTIVDSKAEIRFGAFIRGSVIVGKRAVVGNSSELKNCILFDEVQVPHFNYVGDSVLGFKSHIGAGVILSNLKSDKSEVSVKFFENKIKTGLRKFGAVLGDLSEIGCNAVLNPGTIVGRYSTVYPLTMVRGVLPENKILKNNGDIVDKI